MPDMFDLMDDQAIELDRQKSYIRDEIGEGECTQVDIGSEMGIGIDVCDCDIKHHLRVCQSGAGFYVGIMDHDGSFCRATGYFPTAELAQAELDAAVKSW